MRSVLPSTLAITVAMPLVLGGASAHQDGQRRRPNSPYVTPSGETVDKPGLPQGSGTTRTDRDIQRQDDQIDNSLCKGC